MANPCICKSLADKNNKHSMKCFGNLWLFENFNEDEYNLLKSIGKQKKIQRGQTIFSQGDPADEIFLIKTGRIVLTKYSEDGMEITLDYRKEGELFGEDVFVNENLYPVHATAMEDTITCGAHKKDIEKIVLENANIGLKMMKNMSKNIYSLVNRLESVTLGDLEQRLYKVLIDIVKMHGVKTNMGYKVSFPLTHEELGFLVNAHRVSVTKSLSRLIDLGKVIKDGKYFVLPDEQF